MSKRVLLSEVKVTLYKGAKILTSKDDLGWDCFTHHATGGVTWVWGDFKSEEEAIEAGKSDIDKWDYETTKV